MAGELKRRHTEFDILKAIPPPPLFDFSGSLKGNNGTARFGSSTGPDLAQRQLSKNCCKSCLSNVLQPRRILYGAAIVAASPEVCTSKFGMAGCLVL